MSVAGVDVGGTFTDVVLLQSEGAVQISKVPTQPQAFADGVLAGLDSVGTQIGGLDRLVHGTTVATNALLERTGAKLGMLTTAGFRDVLTIGRTQRSVQYDPSFRSPQPLVPPELTLEIRERTTADGTILIAPDRAEVLARASALVDAGVEALAVCFLWSIANPANEQAVAAHIAEAFADVPVFCSSSVLPEIREYERFSTTVMTAYLAPRVERYVKDLDTRLSEREFRGTLRIMQSNGGLLSPDLIAPRAANTLVSGPAGGVIAARRIGAAIGESHLITVDVGGTSTDVCLIADGNVVTTRERSVERYPVRVPMIDIHTVGAGGGSIARIDSTGALRVGPASAGSMPGPACYGRGGTLPTVTDAYVVSGKIAEQSLLGGAMQIEKKLAEAAIAEHVAGPLGISVEAAADGITRVAENHVNQAIRVVSVEKGFDPRDFVLAAFGGAGPLQAAAIAEQLSIDRVLVPAFPGVTSALGLLAADATHDFLQTRITGFETVSAAELTRWFEPLEAEGLDALEQEGVPAGARTLLRSVEMRYRGQAYEIEVPLAGGRDLTTDDIHRTAERFHQLHERLRGIVLPENPLELVALRLRAVGEIAVDDWAVPAVGDERDQRTTREIRHQGEPVEATVLWRPALGPGAELAGPAIVESRDATVFVPRGWTGRVDAGSNLMLEKDGRNA